MSMMPLVELMAKWRPGSADATGWTWDDEETDLLARRACACCEQTGHYQQGLETDIRRNGIIEPVLLGDDGRVWNGHHRIVAARRLGIVEVPVEYGVTRGEGDGA